MAVSIISGTNDKPAASQALAEIVRGCQNLSGKLFIGFPVIGTYQGRRLIDALWASENVGFVAFDLVEGTDPYGYSERQDNFAAAIESKLRSRPDLVRRSGRQRNLLVPVHTVTFAPGMLQSPSELGADYPVANAENLVQVLTDFRWIAEEGGKSKFDTALSALENVSTIRRTGGDRSLEQPNSRGAKLTRLEDSVATLDARQGKAMLETAAGVQRIRGLAGSGKTIVLALKAAYLHARHPEWRIAVTFQTRSLKGFFRRLITDSFVSQTSEVPDWDILRVIHAWGAPGDDARDGIYHQFCRATGATYLDYGHARRRLGSANPFDGACKLALQKAGLVDDLYDVILVDEAQDLPASFLRICYELLTRDKRLVYAYDELQNLGKRSLPAPAEIFGKEVQLPDDSAAGDIVLNKCYRNSRPVLTTAHALGFGIYRTHDAATQTGIVQMFDDPQMWHDVGYRAASGGICDGEPVVLERREDTSPRFLEDHSELDDLVQFGTFDSEDQQAEWVAEQIESNIRNDELSPDDIVVINPDPFSTAEAVGPVRALLLDKGIQSHLAGVDTGADVFYQPDSVTFTGIYRAKGNEFGMVYLINAHDCYAADHGLARFRNRLFVAITRSKAWVRVCGVGQNMQRLTDEHSKLRDADYQLRFVYPTERQRRNMRIVHREVSDADIRRLEGHKDNISSLISDVQADRVYPEDLADIVPKLQELLAVREGRRGRGDR